MSTGLLSFVDMAGCSARYGRSTVLEACSFSVKHGERWAVLGPNGAGKSTLVKMVAGLLPAADGIVSVNGKPVVNMRAVERAKIMAYVPQKPDGVIPYSVRDYLMLGRYAHRGLLRAPSRQDRDAVAAAVAICDIEHITTRLMYTLSGGELQRVLLAGAIAQETPLLILDEPTSFLDPAHERFFFDALGRLHESREVTLIMVTHDINSALFRCSHILALRDRQTLFCGTAAEFTAECPGILNRLFSTAFATYRHHENGAMVFGAWGGEGYP